MENYKPNLKLFQKNRKFKSIPKTFHMRTNFPDLNKTLFIFSLIILSTFSCSRPSNDLDLKTSDNQWPLLFNNHQEILDVYKSTIAPEFLVSQSKRQTSYERIFTEKGYNISVSVQILNDTTPLYLDNRINPEWDGILTNRYIGGIGFRGLENPKHFGYANIQFDLPDGQDLTLVNILKNNKSNLTDDFISLDETFDGGPSFQSIFSLNKKIMHGNGELIRLQERSKGGYFMAEFLNDTIEYCQYNQSSRNHTGRNGRYFRKDIVHLDIPYDKYENPANIELYNVDFVKYIAYEGNFHDDLEIGKHIERKNGILAEIRTYEEGGFLTSKKSYWNDSHNLYFFTSDSLYTEMHSPDGEKYLWSNQDKYNIKSDNRGYKSYTPLLRMNENKIKITHDSRGEIYVRHGKYEEFDYYPLIPPVRPRNLYEYKRSINANYKHGFLDGEVITLNEFGSASFIGKFENGNLIHGKFRDYDYQLEYDGYETYSVPYLKYERIIDQNGLRWTEQSISGEIIDEGFMKITPNAYFYVERNGLDLDFDRRGENELLNSNN